MATLFEAYVTNAGKYSEGQLVGETLKFPTTAQEVEALLKRIGVDGVRYQEIFITSFDGDVLGLYDHLSEYENLDELNHLACLLSELTSSELETLEAVLDSGDHCSSVRDIINLTQNLDCYGFYPGVSDEETLGRIYVDDLEMLDVPDQVKPYFDYEAYVHRTNNGKRISQYTCSQYSKVPVGKLCTTQHRINEDVVLSLVSEMLKAMVVFSTMDSGSEKSHPLPSSGCGWLFSPLWRKSPRTLPTFFVSWRSPALR